MRDGYSDKDIEEIQKFYNVYLRNKELSKVLAEIEAFYLQCTSRNDLSKLNKNQVRSDVTLKFEERDTTEQFKYETGDLSNV